MKPPKRYILIPSLLMIYFIAMTALFGVDLLRKGEYFRFFSTVAVELLLIAGSYFALRRRWNK